MSGLTKLRLIGVGWTLLVGVLVSVMAPVLQTTAFFFAMPAFALGWLILLNRADRASAEAAASRTAAAMADAQLFAETGATLLRCSQSFGGQFDSIRSELLRVQQLLTEAIANLVASFDALSARAKPPFSETMAPNVGQAVMSLQFQDVVAQLLGHVTKRLDELHGIMREIDGASALVENAAAGGFSAEQADRLRAHLNLALSRLDQLHDNTENSPVRQERFSGGEVVLF